MVNPNETTFFPLGDSSFIIKVGNSISVDSHKRIRAWTCAFQSEIIEGIVEVIPAYNELLILYDPLLIHFTDLLSTLKEIEKKINLNELPSASVVHIPVCYEDDFAPDIELVAETNNLTKNEVIELHSSVEYLVYMLGFTPGFCYLGGLDSRIITPRKDTPRLHVEAGSVGIAGNQTGVYPIDSPGGWQLIGKTPVPLFDPKREPIFLIEAGNYIKFDPITKVEYFELSNLIKMGKYSIRKESKHA